MIAIMNCSVVVMEGLVIFKKWGTTIGKEDFLHLFDSWYLAGKFYDLSSVCESYCSSLRTGISGCSLTALSAPQPDPLVHMVPVWICP